jgi:hypothetical protein
MRLQTLFGALPLLCGVAYAQSPTVATREYNNVCPSRNGKEYRVQLGLFVTFYCDQAPTGFRSVGHYAATLNDCVLACEADDQCVGSLWSARAGPVCNLIQGTGKPKLQSKTKVVYATYRRGDKDECPAPIGCPPDCPLCPPATTCPPATNCDACEAKNKQLQTDLDKSLASNKQLQANLDTYKAKDTVWKNKQYALDQCAGNNGRLPPSGAGHTRLTATRKLPASLSTSSLPIALTTVSPLAPEIPSASLSNILSSWTNPARWLQTLTGD